MGKFDAVYFRKARKDPESPMKRFWFSFTENHPLFNFVQPVLAKSKQHARAGTCRFYSGRCYLYKESETNPCPGKHCLPALIIGDGVIKVGDV